MEEKKIIIESQINEICSLLNENYWDSAKEKIKESIKSIKSKEQPGKTH